MAGTSIITSSANDRLKIVRRLARRRDPAVFLAEGHRQLRCALAAGVVERLTRNRHARGLTDNGL